MHWLAEEILVESGKNDDLTNKASKEHRRK